MSDSLLALSGPTFGNIDITTYQVYSAYIQKANNEATLFSDLPWTWCIVDIMSSVSGVMIRPFTISRNSITSDVMAMTFHAVSGTTATSLLVYWTATLTSLVVKTGNGGTTCTVYVPSN